MLYPPDPLTERATMREAHGLQTREGITINLFLLPSWSQDEDDIAFAYRSPRRRAGASSSWRARSSTGSSSGTTSPSAGRSSREARTLVPELMDDPGIDPREHRRALDGLARLNRVSMIERPIWREIRALHTGAPMRVLDIAAGSGDLVVALARRAARRELPIRSRAPTSARRPAPGSERTPIARGSRSMPRRPTRSTPRPPIPTMS